MIDAALPRRLRRSGHPDVSAAVVRAPPAADEIVRKLPGQKVMAVGSRCKPGTVAPL
jgi:hypothetical protein